MAADGAYGAAGLQAEQAQADFSSLQQRKTLGCGGEADVGGMGVHMKRKNPLSETLGHSWQPASSNAPQVQIESAPREARTALRAHRHGSLPRSIRVNDQCKL